jgi:hypothetical protein
MAEESHTVSEEPPTMAEMSRAYWSQFCQSIAPWWRVSPPFGVGALDSTL